MKLRTAILVLAASGLMARGEPPTRLEQRSDYPAFIQTEPAGEFPNRGLYYCAPVTVSNSLMVLFAPELEEKQLKQTGLIEQLADRGYMCVNPEVGIRGPNLLLRAVERFVSNHGVRDHSLELVGIRSCQRRFSSGFRKPRLRMIHENLAAGAAVWLSIGWYEYSEETGIYKRDSGHWITAVGYGTNAEGKPDPRFLSVHDPRMSDCLKVGLRPLEQGRIEGASPNFSFSAQGVCELDTGFPMKSGADIALLEAAVILKIPGRSMLDESPGLSETP